jgi:hypothetical protein
LKRLAWFSTAWRAWQNDNNCSWLLESFMLERYYPGPGLPGT